MDVAEHGLVDTRYPEFLMASNWGLAVRALKSRNYRLFFGGQSISLIGTWMTRIATSWLVYRLTDSALLLGISGFAGQIPAFFFAPIAGVLIDRWDRRRTLLVTQVLAMVQSFVLAALALSGHINIWWIVSLALFQGLINAFDMPARQAFVIQMIDDRRDLSNAIALNSSMVNGSRLLGPAIAGVVIAGRRGRLLLPDRRNQLHRRDPIAHRHANHVGGPAERGNARDS